MTRSTVCRAWLAASAIAGLLAPSTTRAQAAPVQPPADLIVTNARIYTVDDSRPLAAAMAIRGGRIAFVGDARGAMTMRGAQTRVVDLGGRTVIPGMMDAHGHVAGLGDALAIVDLVGSTSVDDVVARVAARAKGQGAGQWIQGRGWDQNRWGDTRFPTHDKLSAALPDHPVVLTRVDGHAVYANRKAMDLAGITAATKDPDGGQIIRDASGAPTGVFIDNAMGLVRRAVPAQTRDEVRRNVQAAIADAHRWGLTGVHDAGASETVLDVYDELGRTGQMNFRMYAMISGGRTESAAVDRLIARGPVIGAHNGTLWVRSIKLYSDGALGSRGAALLDPYSDDVKNSGLLVSDPAFIKAISVKALKAGFQVNTHAIGDRGNRVTLDAFEAALKEVPVADHRFRVEHAQIINYADIPRFAQLGVIPSMQASHQTSDMYWAGARLGQHRLPGAYAWRSLLNSGVVIPNGSDFPVEYVNPLISFHAAISRQDANDFPAGGWFPEQIMTREEALKSMTIWPAYAGFQERELGSLTPGKHADFVVLDQDIMQVPASLVLKTRVISTWVAGRAVYEAGGRTP
ncbi:MAG: amidohydrolase family protein [Gemmatimonadetes bacterium]|nr:amidohydrolase family protein [Gemmatimonadota bacterium]